jgi:putative ATPase
MAINYALSAFQQQGDLQVPLPIRNAHNQLMKKLNYGKDYRYSHNYENNFKPQEYLPD